MKVIWLRKQYSIATNFTIEMVLIGINVIVPIKSKPLSFVR